MGRRALSLAVLALALAGCAGQPSIADCGLLLHVPARPIDEGWRFDVREVAGDPPGVDEVDYRFLHRADPAQGAVLEGNVAALLASGGNHTLKFLDAREDSLLGEGDAFVVKGIDGLVLQLARGTTLIGSSLACGA